MSIRLISANKLKQYNQAAGWNRKYLKELWWILGCAFVIYEIVRNIINL